MCYLINLKIFRKFKAAMIMYHKVLDKAKDFNLKKSKIQPIKFNHPMFHIPLVSFSKRIQIKVPWIIFLKSLNLISLKKLHKSFCIFSRMTITYFII